MPRHAHIATFATGSAIGLAFVIVAAAPASAQADAGNGLASGDIIVTARKTSERLQDVPIAITALTTQSLAKFNVTDTQDIRYVTPGLFAEQGQLDASSVYFNIRGQSSASGFYESSVGVYVDGVYQQSQNGLNGALFDLERVEVLKGPQGTLYGKNTTGGVINIISKAPDLDNYGGYFSETLGTYADPETSGRAIVKTEGAANLPFIPGVLALRVSANWDYDEGYARNLNGQALNNTNYPYVRAQLRYKPAPNWNILLSGNYGHFRSNGVARTLREAHPGLLSTAVGVAAGYINIADLPSAANPAGGPSFASGTAQAITLLSRDFTDDQFFLSHGTSETFSRLNSDGASLTIDGDLGDNLHLKSVSAYRHQLNANNNDVDGTPFNEFASTFYNKNDYYSQEFNLASRFFDNKLELLAGGFYSHFKDHRGGIPGVGTQALTALTGVATQFDSDYTSESLGFFGHGVFHVNDKLSLTAGVRWSQDKRRAVPLDRVLSLSGDVIACQSVQVGTTPLLGGTVANGCRFPTQRHSDSGVSYEFAVNYKIAPDVMVYATTRRGFRAGDLNTNAQYLAFNPEYATDYELGIKSQFFDRRVLFNVAAYYTNYKNVQKAETIVNFGPPIAVGTAVTNAAKARIYGLEAELQIHVTKALQLSANYTYTNPKYLKFLEPTTTPGVFIDASSDQWEVPKHMYNVSADYTIDLPGDSDLVLSANVYGQSRLIFGANLDLTSSEQILKQSSYALLGARITYDIKKNDMSVAAFGTNLNDKHYYGGAGALRQVGISYLIPQAPRVVGVQFIKHF